MYNYKATIVEVLDGDTIVCDVDMGFKTQIKEMKFRLFGIDTPELSTDKGKEVKDLVTKLLPVGCEITIETIKIKKTGVEKLEKFGRYLANVFVEGQKESINDMLVREKLAVAYFGRKKIIKEKINL